MNLKGKKVTVMGLGLVGGGKGIVKWLVKNKAEVLVTDLRTSKELEPSLKELKGLPVKYILGKHRNEDFETADLIIKNPAVPWDSKYLKIAEKKSIPVETDISLFFQHCPCPIIAITGTKGKSTVTSLVGEIFKRAGFKTIIAGNIGKSPLEFLPIINNQLLIIILELSSWQLEDLSKIGLSPHIALITNIYPDHLNRYASMKAYIAAKMNIFKYQKSSDIAIFNYDNQITKRVAESTRGKCFYFSTQHPVRGIFVRNKKIVFRKKKTEHKICSVKDIKIAGWHNLENVLAAVSIACLSGVKPKIIKETVRDFKGVAGRLELIGQVGGVKYYNDTTATTPKAVIAALKVLELKTDNLEPRIILIAGGADKKLDFKRLAREIRNKCKAVILLKGTATPKLKKELQVPSSKFQVTNANSMRQAVKIAKRLAQKGDIILLSPACASFGMFQNEFDRGRQFIHEVNKLRSLKKSLRGVLPT